MDMDHMPDYARLDKPKRPPVPEVSSDTLLRSWDNSNLKTKM